MKVPTFAYYIFGIIFASLLIFTPAYLFHSKQKEDKKALYFSSKMAQEHMQFEAIKTSYKLVAQNVFDNIIDTQEITSIMSQANKSEDPEVLNVLRETLYNRLQPLYHNLKKQHISQLHFHLQGNISFLRFHKPSKFGDSLNGIRYSIDKVNVSKKQIHGFEEGRVFNGYRDVFPLNYRNKFVGTVELSYSFEAIKNEAKKIHPAHYAFLLNKDIVESKIFKSELKNYTPSFLSVKYLQDKRSLDINSTILDPEIIKTINHNIRNKASEKIALGQDFLLESSVNEKPYIITFIAIDNIENKQMAYLISYRDDINLIQIEQTYETQLIISFIAALIFSILLMLYIRLQKEAARSLEVMATTDPLTKIANRNRLNMVMDASINTAQRYNLPLSIIFFDIDNFKFINDKLGHETGDEILVELSALINGLIRSSDLLARWGGEEFIIVLPETNRVQAKNLAEKLRIRIEEHHFVITAKLTCSFGVTQLHKDDNESSLLKRVDTALYSAKDSGKNRVIELN